MNYLSLFSGIGGLDLGLDRAGMTCVGQVETDPFCRAVLAAHWPEVPRHADVTTAPGWWLGEPRPVVDAVVGGFPCQPVSEACKGLAQDDPRWLWPAMADVIAAARPRWVIAENVPGLFRRGFGDVLADLAALGFDAEWDCVPASAVGAPHRRDRVFIVAYPAGQHRRPQTVDLAARLRGETASDRPSEPDRRGSRRASMANPPRIRLDAGQLDSAPVLHWPTPARSSWWQVEPRMGRVAHGVPAQVDRLRALGNAVVPQVAEHIGRLVMAGAQ